MNSKLDELLSSQVNNEAGTIGNAVTTSNTGNTGAMAFIAAPQLLAVTPEMVRDVENAGGNIRVEDGAFRVTTQDSSDPRVVWISPQERQGLKKDEYWCNADPVEVTYALRAAKDPGTIEQVLAQSTLTVGPNATPVTGLLSNSLVIDQRARAGTSTLVTDYDGFWRARTEQGTPLSSYIWYQPTVVLSVSNALTIPAIQLALAVGYSQAGAVFASLSKNASKLPGWTKAKPNNAGIEEMGVSLVVVPGSLTDLVIKLGGDVVPSTVMTYRGRITTADIGSGINNWCNTRMNIPWLHETYPGSAAELFGAAPQNDESFVEIVGIDKNHAQNLYNQVSQRMTNLNKVTSPNAYRFI